MSLRGDSPFIFWSWFNLKICPLCNGLIQVRCACICGGELADTGPVNDYAGPYSPYGYKDYSSDTCIHLFACTKCGRDARAAIPARDF